MMSFYQEVFLEALGSALLIPASGQRVFFAMQAFGGYDMKIPALVAVAGAMVAMAVNYAIGGFLYYLKQQDTIMVNERIYAKGVALAGKRLLPLLLLAWMPFGALLAVAAGFFNVPAWKALPIMLIGQAGFYAYYGFFH